MASFYATPLTSILGCNTGLDSAAISIESIPLLRSSIDEEFEDEFSDSFKGELFASSFLSTVNDPFSEPFKDESGEPPLLAAASCCARNLACFRAAANLERASRLTFSSSIVLAFVLGDFPVDFRLLFGVDELPFFASS